MNQIDLQDRVAIVTGAARGIGQAIAQRLLASGAHVCLWDLDQARLAQTCGQLQAAYPGRQVLAQALDLCDEAAVTAATEQAAQALGRIEILVNNAGITGGNGPTWALDPQVWRQVVEVNLVAPFLTCRAVVPQMLKNGWGRIVNVASVAAKEGNPNASHYSASKAGLIALTKSLGKELATQGVLVNAVTPAAAKTELFDQMKPEHIDYMLSKIPMNRFVQVDEIAAMVAWLCSPDCSFTTGSVFDISGGRATY
jgi:3-oxoacyl-[acyl-carrier protein] reductase